jgi:hypothetical protein
MIDFTKLFQALRLAPSFFWLARHVPLPDSPFYQPCGDLARRSVVREKFLIDLCRGKRVLHFGFVDAPFSEDRIRKGLLLHQQLKGAAAWLFGLDIDAAALSTYQQLTGDTNHALLDVTAPLPEADFLGQQYDLILFPEVLEHLLRPAEAMANLRQICLRNPGSRLCVTTPNAYSVMGFFAALSGDELVHPDHYFYFSPTLLKKLLTDTGFAQIELRLYSGPELLGSPGLTKHGLIAVCAPSAGTPSGL